MATSEDEGERNTEDRVEDAGLLSDQVRTEFTNVYYLSDDGVLDRMTNMTYLKFRIHQIMQKPSQMRPTSMNRRCMRARTQRMQKRMKIRQRN